MEKLILDIDSLGVETFPTWPELGQEPEYDVFMRPAPSRNSCIEQCTTSCVP